MGFLPPFSLWLKQRRKTLGMTQIVLAQRLGYAVITLRKIEAGNLRPSQQMAEALANTLQIPETDRASFVNFARGLDVHLRYSNLPALITSLVGRDRDLADLAQMLASSDTRLLSLLGPPGVGKTRLALALAQRVESDFQHGAVFVPLASLHRPDQVTPAIAHALDVRVPPDQPALDVLRRFLHDKHLLLILDNFEHLLDAAPIATELLAISPCLKVVATSRAPLRIVGEHTFDLQPLDVPNLQHLPAASALHLYSAVDLFVQRAHAVKSSFALTPDNAPAVAEICQRLDGLPLAIELAAVRARAFTPQTMLTHLDHHIGASLRFLVASPRDLPPRQQTLRHAIDWSYGLLSPDEQRLFCRLSIFAGGCTLQAAQAVCAWSVDDAPPDSDVARNAVADALASLVEQSLVQETEGPEGESRYTLLETIREYALEQMDAQRPAIADWAEADLVHDRHLTYYLQVGRAATALFEGSLAGDQVSVTQRLACDQDNARGALEWAVSAGRVDDSMRMANAWTAPFILCNAQGEILARLRGLMAQVETATATPALAEVLINIADIHARQREFDQAADALERAQAVCLALDDPALRSRAEMWQGILAQLRGDFAESRRHFEAWRELMRSGHTLGEKAQRLMETDLFGHLAFAEGDYASAQCMLEQHHALLDPADKNERSVVARDLGYALLYQGKRVSAAAYFSESLLDNHAIGSRQAVAACVAACGALAVARGDLARAARLFGASEAISQAIRTPLMTSDDNHVRRHVAALRERVDGATFAAAWAKGQAMTLDQAVEYALKACEETP